MHLQVLSGQSESAVGI